MHQVYQHEHENGDASRRVQRWANHVADEAGPKETGLASNPAHAVHVAHRPNQLEQKEPNRGILRKASAPLAGEYSVDTHAPPEPHSHAPPLAPSFVPAPTTSAPSRKTAAPTTHAPADFAPQLPPGPHRPPSHSLPHYASHHPTSHSSSSYPTSHPIGKSPHAATADVPPAPRPRAGSVFAHEGQPQVRREQPPKKKVSLSSVWSKRGLILFFSSLVTPLKWVESEVHTHALDGHTRRVCDAAPRAMFPFTVLLTPSPTPPYH